MNRTIHNWQVKTFGFIFASILHEIEIKNPRRKQRSIEDLYLRALRIRGNISPAPPDEPPQRGGELDPKGFK